MTSLSKEQRLAILTPAVERILKALSRDGEARVVGGAVRDVLMSRRVGDIDLATTVLPERVQLTLEAQGIKTVATGLAHGTVTAVVDRVGYEITTLRTDIETDGRHAIVAFTDDWLSDASRRDFTLNALYVDAEGNLYDYFDGLADAKSATIKFIGDAHARIKEDVLRILRYFRFYATFGSSHADTQALNACHDLAHLMPRLSAERVARETLKLLSAANPYPSWALLANHDVLPYFLAEGSNLSALKLLIETEAKQQEYQSAFVRLSALLSTNAKVAQAVAARLKLSKSDAERLIAMAKLPGAIRNHSDPLSFRALLYRFGVEHVRAASFLSGANLQPLLKLADTWQHPSFPLKGQDIVALGRKAGPEIGTILKDVEEWWIAGDFAANREECLRQAKSIVSD